MFKARKAKPPVFRRSQASSQSSNTENVSQNVQPESRQIPESTSNHDDDEDLFVPPSQDHVTSCHELRSQRNERRRFLSQRSQSRYVNSMSQSRSTSVQQHAKSYFESVLKKTGVTFDDNFYLLNCDVYKFQNRFDETIRAADNYPVNLPILIKDVKNLLSNSNDDWRKLMTSVRFYLPVGDSSEHPEDDAEIRECLDNSMIRILLMNEQLQRDMFDMLFEELRRRTKVQSESQLEEFTLIVKQMRFIDFRDHADYIFHEYFEILSLCNAKTREILIYALVDLIIASKHSIALNKILDIITTPEELFSVKNLETFGKLCLDTPTMNKIRTKIIHYINNGAPKLILYDLLTFMCRFNRLNDDNETMTYYEVINEIRNCVKWDMEETDVKLKVYGLVKRSINRCAVTRQSWLKAIKYIGNAREHKIVDPLVCFMIGLIENEASNIENFFKKRVKERLFTIDLIQQMARNASEILPEYVPIMTDIFKACFCDRDKYTALFGAVGFRILFKIRGGDRRYPLQSLISLACTRPSDVPFLSDNDTKTNALELLLEIKRKLKNEADGGFFQVEKILDRSTYLSIDQYRIVIKILCSLAYDGAGNDNIKTDLEIMAPKHVTNMHLRTKLQGIVIVFQILNQTMWIETSDSEEYSFQFSNDSSSTMTLSQIDVSDDYKNGSLLKLTLKASEHNVEALMFYYDELASVISARSKSIDFSLNTKFAKWLQEQIETSFQNVFVVNECPVTSGHETPMDYFFNINTPLNDEDVNTDAIDIGVNLGQFAMNNSSSTKATTSIQLVCPMFNALATVTFRRCKSNLERINALLGCALVLPMNFLKEEKMLQEHGSLAIDMYFHVANWLRCVISAFACQTDSLIRKKILRRISLLIEIEASIKYLLQKGDRNYNPPPTTFQLREDFTFVKPTGVPKRTRKEVISEDEDSDEDDRPGPSNKGKGGRNKRQKTKKTGPSNVITQFDEESMNLNLNTTSGNLPVQTQFNVPTQGTQSADTVKHHAKYWFSYGTKEKYRQIDMDIMLLLSEDLEIVYPAPATRIKQCLYLQELKFILTDLISKTESIAGVKKFRTEQQTQVLGSTDDYIYDLVLSLSHVMRFKKQLSAYLQEKIKEMDSEDSVPLYSDEMNHAKICFGCCLHLLAALFSWPGFSIDDNHKMLRIAFDTIIEDTDDEVMTESTLIEEMAEKALNTILSDEPTVLDLRSAVHLLHLVKPVALFAEKPEVVVSLAEKLLKRQWIGFDGTKEINKNANILLTEILKSFMRDMELSPLEQVVDVFSVEMITLKAKSDYMPSFPNFNRSNCTIFYRIIAATCQEAMKHCIATLAHAKDLLKCWKKCFDIMEVLLEVNEKNHIFQNTVTFLKYAHNIIKIFRSNGVKAMDSIVKKNHQAVHELLKSMQKTSRFLHNLSCDTKDRANNRTLRQIPALRETMEKLVVEVKSSLAHNHALSGYWLANLNNKNLRGEILMSQILTSDAAAEDEEESIDDDVNSPENSDGEDEMDQGDGPAPSVLSSRSSKVFD